MQPFNLKLLFINTNVTYLFKKYSISSEFIFFFTSPHIIFARAQAKELALKQNLNHIVANDKKGVFT